METKFKRYQFKPNNEEEFNQCVREWEEMGYKCYDSGNGKTYMENGYDMLFTDSKGDWYICDKSNHQKQYYLKIPVGPKQITATENAIRNGRQLGELTSQPYLTSIDDCKQSSKGVLQEALDSLYNIKNTKKMETRNETIQERKVRRFFTEKKLDEITDIVEKNEELVNNICTIINFLEDINYEICGNNDDLQEAVDERDVSATKDEIKCMKKIDKDIEKNTILQQLLQFVEVIEKENSKQ